MFKDYIKKLLDKTTIDEKIKVQLTMLDLKARREIDRLANKQFKNGFLTGLVVGVFVLLAFLTATGNL